MSDRATDTVYSQNNGTAPPVSVGLCGGGDEWSNNDSKNKARGINEREVKSKRRRQVSVSVSERAIHKGNGVKEGRCETERSERVRVGKWVCVWIYSKVVGRTVGESVR